MTECTLVEALNLGLAHALASDPQVVVLGEDVARNGGVFRVTAGLAARFGERRVIDTPLAEGLIAGLAVGMAAEGMRPVAEIQFAGFAYVAIDQLVNHAGRLRHRTRGRLACPMVLRMPVGAGIRAPEHHSESPEAMFAHIPGIRVVCPSSPARGYGLLLAAIADPDPVVFLEPARLYRLTRAPVTDDGAALPLDRAFIERSGDDLTFVTWGAMTHDVLAVARRLEAEDVTAEVIDMATLKPLDMATVLDSVRRTGRCVIVNEAPHTASLAAEIAAGLAEHGLLSLVAPVERVGGWDTVTPLSRLENRFMPDRQRILAAAKRVLAYG